MLGNSRARHATGSGNLALPVAPVLNRERARPVRDVIRLTRHSNNDLCQDTS